MTFSALETVVNPSSGSDEPYSGSDWKAIRRATEEKFRGLQAQVIEVTKPLL
jgi:hypothetical protein